MLLASNETAVLFYHWTHLSFRKFGGKRIQSKPWFQNLAHETLHHFIALLLIPYDLLSTKLFVLIFLNDVILGQTWYVDKDIGEAIMSIHFVLLCNVVQSVEYPRSPEPSPQEAVHTILNWHMLWALNSCVTMVHAIVPHIMKYLGLDP